jgi:hypothetical protein
MRVQDNVLLQTAAAWDGQCPSALPRLRKINFNVASIVSPKAVSVACAAFRSPVLVNRWNWKHAAHATVSDQVERHS